MGPGTLRHPNSQTDSRLQSRTEAPAHYPHAERRERTTHKALTEKHAEGEERKHRLKREGGEDGETEGGEGCGNGEQEEEDVGVITGKERERQSGGK